VFASFVVCWGSGRRGAGLAEGAVRPVGVVVALVLAQYGSGMLLVDYQHAVEEFTANATDEAFGDRVGPRGLHGRPDDADVDRGEDGVERRGELRVPIPDEESEAAAGIVEVHEQVASLLGQPGAGRLGGDAEDVHPAGGVLDDEENIAGAR
jgi:hypothetical protein